MRLHKQAAAVALACLVVFIACYSAVGMQNDVLAAGGATGASRTSTALAIAGAALLAVSPPADLAEEPFGGAVEQRQRDASDGGDSDDGDRPGGVTGHCGFMSESSDGEGEGATLMPSAPKHGGRRPGAGRKLGSASQPKPPGERTEQRPPLKRRASAAPDDGGGENAALDVEDGEDGEDTAPLAMGLQYAHPHVSPCS